MQRDIKFRVWDEFPKYEIGDDGSVYSLQYRNTNKRVKMQQYLDQDGYPYVYFVVSAVRYKRVVHRMVAKLFVPNTDNKPQVNHKDGNRANNDYVNLEWVTAQENVIHSFRVNGRKITEKQRNGSKERFSGVNNPKSKINHKIADKIRAMRSSGMFLKDIAAKVGISISQVSVIALNKNWKQNGL